MAQAKSNLEPMAQEDSNDDYGTVLLKSLETSKHQLLETIKKCESRKMSPHCKEVTFLVDQKLLIIKETIPSTGINII